MKIHCLCGIPGIYYAVSNPVAPMHLHRMVEQFCKIRVILRVILFSEASKDAVPFSRHNNLT